MTTNQGQKVKSQARKVTKRIRIQFGITRYNSATEGRINFKLGENFHCERQNIRDTTHLLDQ